MASRFISLTSAVIQDAAEQLYDQTLMKVTDSLALAFVLFCKAENAGVPSGQNSTVDELAGQFFWRINRHICKRLDDAPVSEKVDAYLALPQFDLRGVDMDVVHSPARREMLKRQIGSKIAV